jgi:hypothetical protein
MYGTWHHKLMQRVWNSRSDKGDNLTVLKFFLIGRCSPDVPDSIYSFEIYYVVGYPKWPLC